MVPSLNCGARAKISPCEFAMSESPSKTNSSWPPTIFTYATGEAISCARREINAERESSLSLS